jgi:phage virion morphogenesis protein
MLEIKIEDAELVQPLERLIKGLANASPLMAALAGDMLDEVEENFQQEGRPAWMGLKPGTIAARQKKGHWPGKILQVSGRLASSSEPFHSNVTAGVGTNIKYAAIQNSGGKTRPHVIRPRNKKALAFGGRVVKKVNHPGSTIPARPFYVLSPARVLSMTNRVSDYLRKLAL